MGETQNVTIKELGGVKMVGEVLHSSDTQLKIMHTCEFLWETTLQLEAGKAMITSGNYVVDFGTEHESVWRIELNPNYVGQRGLRFVSIYLVLVKTKKADDVKCVMFKVLLPTTMNFQDQDAHYVMSTGLTNFSKQKPAYGFEEYIALSKLGSLANPESMEKLQVVIILSELKDVPISEEPEKEVNSVEQTSMPPPPSPHKADAFVQFEKALIPVDSERLSYYTSFFDKYIVKKGKRANNRTPDLSACFSNKTLLMKIIEFCHTGKIQMPKRLEGLCNVLKASLQVEVSQLRSKCQTEILNRLNVDNFIEIVTIARDGFLDQQEAYPAIYKYMIENIGELGKNNSYSVNYEDFKEFYQNVMLYCEEADDANSTTDPADDELSGWINFYINPPH